MQPQKSTVSPKFQITIPKKVRDLVRLKPYEHVLVSEQGGKIVIESETSIDELYGVMTPFSSQPASLSFDKIRKSALSKVRKV